MDILQPKVMLELYKHGVDCYPDEACGFVLGNQTVYRSENIQNDLHRKDPKLYPRDATRGYTMSLKDIRYLEASFSKTFPVSTIYHSHPDVGAYFSHEDSSKALFCGEPIYDVSYLVLDIKSNKPNGAKNFSFIDGRYVCTAEYDLQGKLLTNSTIQSSKEA